MDTHSQKFDRKHEYENREVERVIWDNTLKSVTNCVSEFVVYYHEIKREVNRILM